MPSERDRGARRPPALRNRAGNHELAGRLARAGFTVTGLDPRYGEARARTNNVSPLGIDLFLVDPGGRVAGIPRTTSVEAS